jgi:hypothetical protein
LSGFATVSQCQQLLMFCQFGRMSEMGLGRVKTLVKEGQDWERQRGEEVARRAYAVSAAISCLAPMMFITLVRL